MREKIVYWFYKNHDMLLFINLVLLLIGVLMPIIVVLSFFPYLKDYVDRNALGFIFALLIAFEVFLGVVWFFQFGKILDDIFKRPIARIVEEQVKKFLERNFNYSKYFEKVDWGKLSRDEAQEIRRVLIVCQCHKNKTDHIKENKVQVDILRNELVDKREALKALEQTLASGGQR